MSETEPNRREEILQAALEVFAEYGYQKATIKQIARRAGLKSPALIYWYFENKEELLHAVIGMVAPVIGQAADPTTLLGLPPEQALTLVGTMMLSALENPRTGQLFKVFMSEAIHRPDSVLRIAVSGPFQMLNLLKAYFQHQIELGTIRPCDPEAVARAFIGTLVIYIMGKEILPPLGEGFPPVNEYVPEIVRVFLDGLRVEKG